MWDMWELLGGWALSAFNFAVPRSYQQSLSRLLVHEPVMVQHQGACLGRLPTFPLSKQLRPNRLGGSQYSTQGFLQSRTGSSSTVPERHHCLSSFALLCLRAPHRFSIVDSRGKVTWPRKARCLLCCAALALLQSSSLRGECLWLWLAF